MNGKKSPKRIAEEAYRQFGTNGARYGYDRQMDSGFSGRDFFTAQLLGYVLQFGYKSNKEGEEFDYYHNSIGLPALFQVDTNKRTPARFTAHHWIADWDALSHSTILGPVGQVYYTRLERDGDSLTVHELENLTGPLAYNRPNNLWFFHDGDGRKFCITSTFINEAGDDDVSWIHA